MLLWLLLRLAINAVAFAVAQWLIPSFDVKGGFWALLWIALLFGLVNAIIGPFLRLIALPLTILTFGLFALVVNGVVIAIVAGLSKHLDVGGFGWTILAALVISIVSAALGFFADKTFARS
jgi:putative membrane protein